MLTGRVNNIVMESELEKIAYVYGDVCVRTRKQRRKRQKLLIIDVLYDYAKNSTLHGLRYMVDRGLSIIEKLFWFITIAVSIGLCSYYINNLYLKWKTSPVIVTVNERQASVGTVPFPAVTICPQIKVKPTFYNMTKEIANYHNLSGDDLIKFQHIYTMCEPRESLGERNYSVKTNESFANHLNEVAPQVEDIFVTCLWYNNREECQYLFSKVYTEEGVCYTTNSLAERDIFEKSIQLEYKYMESYRSSVGWSPEKGYDYSVKDHYPRRARVLGSVPDMQILLKSDPDHLDKTCNGLYSGFKIFGSPRQLTIKKLNVTALSSPSFYSNLNDSESDAQLFSTNAPRANIAIISSNEIVRTDDSEVMNNDIISFSDLIYLHHPADFPQSSLYYYAALPNQMSSVAINFQQFNTDISLSDYPFQTRQCFFPEDRKLRFFKIYTAKNCQAECLSNYTLKLCKCVGFYMPYNDSSQICSPINQDCTMEAKDKMSEAEINVELGLDEEGCNCLPACNTIEYEAEILKTEYNARDYINQLKSSFNPKNSYSRIDLYFKKPQFVTMQRRELFGVTDLLANIGGLLGVFLGFSFLSLVEIFYFVTLRVGVTLKRDLKEEKKDKNSKTNDDKTN